jgi:hypothetical protein
MKIITSGRPYIDIDAYAGIISLAELLNLQGETALAYSGSELNESITPAIRSWQAPLQREYIPAAHDSYIIVDVSDPSQFDAIVVEPKVAMVVDHHTGFEGYWQAKIGEQADIEFVGSVCTQLYERWRDSGFLGQMSQRTARLMVPAILDNTLNLKARITTDRDRTAYQELSKLAGLPPDWEATYFSECQQAIDADLPTAIRNDAKTLATPPAKHYPACFGQLVVWDAQEILEQQLPVIRQTLSAIHNSWAMNLVSIKDGTSYIIADAVPIQNFFAQLLDISFDGSIAAASRLWLRKEIMKRLLERPEVMDI